MATIILVHEVIPADVQGESHPGAILMLAGAMAAWWEDDLRSFAAKHSLEIKVSKMPDGDDRPSGLPVRRQIFVADVARPGHLDLDLLDAVESAASSVASLIKKFRHGEPRVLSVPPA